MQQLSIGAASKLTGIPAHTLRKWESRHGIAVPVRTETGRRVYTDAHIETLKLTKLLVERRHALAHLADLSIEELRDLANLHEQPTTPANPASRIALLGPNLSHLLLANTAVSVRSTAPVTATSEYPEGCDTVLVEADTLPETVINVLTNWLDQAQRILLVYRFAPRQLIAKLEAQGIECIAAPVTNDDLASRLFFPPPSVEFDLHPTKFSTEELARIASLTPGIACECPNHIAKLLMDISSFERYSQECIDLDPKEQALHKQLSQISAQARRLFEDALIAVATADGLKIHPESD